MYFFLFSFTHIVKKYIYWERIISEEARISRFEVEVGTNGGAGIDEQTNVVRLLNLLEEGLPPLSWENKSGAGGRTERLFPQTVSI